MWILQALAALLYGASGVMMVFLFDEVSAGVPAFDALPRAVWTALGLLELACAIGLIVPAALRRKPALTVAAAAALALESLVFIWVHVEHREVGPMIASGALGLLMAFVVYGRSVLRPIA